MENLWPCFVRYYSLSFKKKFRKTCTMDSYTILDCRELHFTRPILLKNWSWNGGGGDTYNLNSFVLSVYPRWMNKWKGLKLALFKCCKCGYSRHRRRSGNMWTCPPCPPPALMCSAVFFLRVQSTVKIFRAESGAVQEYNKVDTNVESIVHWCNPFVYPGTTYPHVWRGLCMHAVECAEGTLCAKYTSAHFQGSLLAGEK